MTIAEARDRKIFSELLAELTELAVHYRCVDLVRPLLTNPKFAVWSGSSDSKTHHYGACGLILHTWEVVVTALANAKLYNDPEINEQSVFLSALFHDVGKMWDYAPVFINGIRPAEMYMYPFCNMGWRPTEHKRRVHHISRSALEWSHAVKGTPWEATLHDRVLHNILSHHGCREWGSPVSPNTKEAWLLHLADHMSARLYDCDTNDLIKK